MMPRDSIWTTFTSITVVATSALLASALINEPAYAQQNQRELARETALQLGDAPLSKVFLAVRAAETSANEATLDAIDSCRNDALVRTRVAFARNALRARRAAISAKELVALEDALAEERIKLADATTSAAMQRGAKGAIEEGSPQPSATELELAQSELLLEAAEDLLLNRFTADGSDAALAIGWLSPNERSQISMLLTRIHTILVDQRVAAIRARSSDAAAIATDPAVFRLSMLEGLARLAEADLAQDAPELRAARLRDAQSAITRAAKSELTLPNSVADVLALARVRSLACTPDIAQELLSRAAQSTDATLAWTARVVAWQLASLKAKATNIEPSVFPTLRELRADALPAQGGTLEELAAISESRARLECEQSSLACIEPIARYLRLATGENFGSSAELARRARRMAERIPAQLRDAATRDDAPPLLVALALLDGQGRVSSEALLDRSRSALRTAPQRASRDPLIAPWFTVPYASALSNLSLVLDDREVARDAATEATEALLWLAAQTPPSATTRDAVTVAIDARRTTVEAARANSTQNEQAAAAEAALDAALAIAVARFPSDPQRDAWALARVDLALFPISGACNLAEAKNRLASISQDERVKPLRDLRALEIEFAQLEIDQPKDAAARALALVRPAELLDISIRPPAPKTDATAAALARCDALRAAVALRAARPGEAMTIASRVFRRPLADRSAAERAAKTFVEALLVRDAAGALDDAVLEVPADLLAFASETTALRNLLLPAIAAQRDALERLLDARATIDLDALQEAHAGTASTTEIAQRGRKLDSLVALARAAPTPAPPALNHAAIVAAIAQGNTRLAIDRARGMVEHDRADRDAMWLLAQALLRSTEGAEQRAEQRAESFALCKELSPMTAAVRDHIWWRAQLAQLEILAVDLTAQRATDALARLNRLAAIDAQFGDTESTGAIAQRFARVKKHALEIARAASPSESRRNDVD